MGVKTLDPIAEGSYVMEYLGELIDEKEARRREKLYLSTEPRVEHYLYDILGSSPRTAEAGADAAASAGTKKKTPLLGTIDSTFYGNVSRMVNHSCGGANLVCRVEYGRKSRLPCLLMYAARDIDAGEELLIDYKPQLSTGEDEVSIRAGNGGAIGGAAGTAIGDRLPSGHTLIKCLCGSRNCRGFLWI